MNFEVKDLQKMLRNIDFKTFEKRRRFELAITQAAKVIVQANAKHLAPVKTGALRNSIEEETTNIDDIVEARVFTNLEYAPYVEFGTGIMGDHYNGDDKYPGTEITYTKEVTGSYTSKAGMVVSTARLVVGMEPQPFLYPALKNNEKKIIRYIKKKTEEPTKHEKH